MLLDFIKSKILHIEASSICNAACPMCERNINGVGIAPGYELKNLPLKWFHDNLETISKVEKIYFCGNLGDSASNKDLIKIIKYIKKVNPLCTIGLNTNGGLRSTKFWSEMATLLTGNLDYIVWSIDGLEDTNHLYRWNVKWNKVMENAKAYIDAGGIAHWDMLVFQHNAHQVEECIQVATDMGFYWFRSKETNRWSTKDIPSLEPSSPYIPIDYSKIVDISCERDKEQSTFIDYQGKVWPCCYLGNTNFADKGTKNIEVMNNYKQKIDQKDAYKTCRESCGIVTSKRTQWKREIQIK
jgi:hypothetical protein